LEKKEKNLKFVPFVFNISISVLPKGFPSCRCVFSVFFVSREKTRRRGKILEASFVLGWLWFGLFRRR